MQRLFILFGILLLAISTGSGVVSVPDQLHIGSFAQMVHTEPELLEPTHPYTQMTVVGDVMLARHVEKYLNAYGSSYAYSQLPVMATSTALLGNFEAPIPEEHVPTEANTFRFSVDQQHVPALRAYGFTHMSLANNHAYDSGLPGFASTQEVLKEADVVPVGSPELSSSSISYIEINGTSIAVIAIYALDITPDPAVLAEIVTQAADSSDYQFAYIHWGNEYKPVHNAFQEALAYTLIDLGVDTIFGHHPHVVQDIEIYNDGLIFYSLGNFIFDQYFSIEVQEGLQVTVSPTQSGLQYILDGVSSIGSRSAPRLMQGFERDVFLTDLANKSSEAVQEQIRAGIINL
ncbi:MAG: poly-gamma-glutamate synthesis protein (capsule biosynthesis protein) [Patiriisocius sp.]|jgi:poly-gamma-glutamate synthesis protein (capsule biosynthesis protein)